MRSNSSWLCCVSAMSEILKFRSPSSCSCSFTSVFWRSTMVSRRSSRAVFVSSSVWRTSFRSLMESPRSRSILFTSSIRSKKDESDGFVRKTSSVLTSSASFTRRIKSPTSVFCFSMRFSCDVMTFSRSWISSVSSSTVSYIRVPHRRLPSTPASFRVRCGRSAARVFHPCP